MMREWIRDLQAQLEENLTDRSFLKKIGRSKREMQAELRDADFRHGLRDLYPLECFTCRQILDISRKMMGHFSPEPEEGWLAYLYLDRKHQLYPENFIDVAEDRYEKGGLLYLEILHVLLEVEEQTKGFSPTRHFRFADPEERKSGAEEYSRFLNFCRNNYLVEFMRIASEITPFNTLGHIAGVHYVAMFVARQLVQMGIQVDLGLMSGAAIGHDIGKYGCKDSESKRVPYLHYYYTDQCFKRNNMPGIGYIAANHSTWDLELENLSVESLLLIYADFRVKSVWGSDKQEIIQFYTLADSFQVILSKLDNVDDAKRERYRQVYEKLKDFEDFMINLGVNPSEPKENPVKNPVTDSALLYGNQVVDAYKHQAISHNIGLMHILNNETSFGNILETARSEKEWKNTRSFLNIFREYCTYMNQKQKLLTISFLYELLMHREGDIRLEAARLMGQMIVDYDTEYRKEIPEGWIPFLQESSSIELYQRFLKQILTPDHKIMEKHREWVGYMLEHYVDAVLTHCKAGKRTEYLKETIKIYRKTDWDEFPAFLLMTTLLRLPLELCNAEDYTILLEFLKTYATHPGVRLPVASLRFLNHCLTVFPEKEAVRCYCREVFFQLPEHKIISIQFLKHQVAVRLELEPEVLRKMESLYLEQGVISAAFLENLKTATPWICKQVNVEFLLYMMEHGYNQHPVHTATHLANLLMVSEFGDVRRQAGEVLLRLADYTTPDQCNEVTVELTKGLELGGSEFSKYIPEYLGALILRLHPEEVDEFIQTMETMMIHGNQQVACLILNTLGVLVQNYSSYRSRYEEPEKIYKKRLKRILGLLMRGLANFHEKIAQEAFYVIGEYIFASKRLSLEEKYEIFRFIGKKTLHILLDQSERSLSFLINAASLNHIYRFVHDYYFAFGDFCFPMDGKVAFFPGTFDPFSLSHKGIVQEIRRHGFEVYLAIDEFSWSKKTQPRLIRRKIAAMSVADDSEVFLFPDEQPVNIANNQDLKILKELFPTKDVYIVVGSDVLAYASAYRKEVSEYSIHQFNHIVFRRNSEDKEEEDSLREPYAAIRGRMIDLSLPMYLEDISSTRIRENVDLNRDISNLIDPIVQNFIYQNNLYLREPQYKPILATRSLNCEFISRVTEETLTELAQTVLKGKRVAPAVLMELQLPGIQLLVLRDDEHDHVPLAFSVFRPLAGRELLQEFGDLELTNEIRGRATGKMVLMLGGYVSSGLVMPGLGLRQLILTETLAHCLAEEYTYCLFHGIPELEEHRAMVQEILERQGFLKISGAASEDLVMVVDMRFPTTLSKNLEQVIKEPFNTNARVLRVLNRSHKKLQSALTQFRPGNLILSFDQTIMHHRLVDKITNENGVQNKTVAPRKLGKKMCVPFGKMIRGSVVPNTVTKALHTERVFHSDMTGFTIQEYPNYSPLKTQIRTIKSFDKEVILVDDLLHKGYRVRDTYHMFEAQGITVRKIILGILSGRGRDLIETFGGETECVYFLPNIHSWYVESTMYPFIGGDSVDGGTKTPGLLTSVNLVLPYVAPTFMMRESREAAYNLSMVCLKNARDILQVLEEEYQREFERNLTLERLSEAIYSPTCPDKGQHMSYDVNLPASMYVENDINRLIRLKNITME